MRKILTVMLAALMLVSLVAPVLATGPAVLTSVATRTTNENEIKVTVSIAITDQDVASGKVILSHDSSLATYNTWQMAATSLGSTIMNDKAEDSITFAWANIVALQPGTYELFTALYTFEDTSIGQNLEFGLTCIELYQSDGRTLTESSATGCSIKLEDVQQYRITLVDAQGNVIGEIIVTEGEEVTLPDGEDYVYGGNTYVFLRWEGNYSDITGDTTITGVYGLLGDANMDDKVNTGDAVVVLRHAVEILTIDGDALKLADYTRDTNLNTGDAVAILRYCVGA